MEMTITTKVTYKYLMNKSKHELAEMVLDLLDKVPDPRSPTLREPERPFAGADENKTDEAIPGVVDDIEELWS